MDEMERWWEKVRDVLIARHDDDDVCIYIFVYSLFQDKTENTFVIDLGTQLRDL